MTAILPPPAPAATTRAPLAIVCSAAFVVVLDFFIVNVALPSMQAGLGASTVAIEWVVAGYGLALAVGLIAGGRLGDRYGRRRMFCLGLALFTLASAFCGLAPSPTVLIIGRIEQGLAAALLSPQILAIIGVVYAGEERLKALGVYGTVMGLAAVGGQLIGGALIAAGLGWRGCFLINVPIGIVTVLLARRHVPESRVAGASRPDLAGTLLLAVTLLALLLPLVEGRQHGWPLWSWVSLGLVVPLAGVFAAQQRRLRGAPLLDRALLATPAFARGLPAQLTLWCGQAAFFMVFALYLQQGRGLGALQAGLVFAVLAAAYVVAASRGATGGRRAAIGGGLSLAAGHACFAVAAGGPLVALVPGMVLVGAGMGLCIPSIMGLLLAEVPPDQAGAAGGILATVQNIGNALGVAITGVVFFGAAGHGLDHAFTLSVVQLGAIGLLTTVAAWSNSAGSTR